MRYKVGYNDSPAKIAHAYRVPFDALIRANPHKPTRKVAGQTTWQGLGLGEEINIPSVGTLGDAVSDVIAALVSAGGPCNRANVALVCAVQRALGVTVDGKYGSGTAAAARAVFPGAPAGCSPTPSWWVKGQSACPSVSAPLPIPVPAAVAPSSAMPPLPSPCDPANVAAVCTLQRALGVTVDGKYGNDTATAARKIDPSFPPGCSPRPSWWKPAGQSNCPGAASAPAPTPAAPAQPPPVQAAVIPVQTAPAASAPAAVQALLSIRPCDPSSVAVVCAAQRALGVTVDGKYGNDTATAARRVLPSAPPGCSPRPTWWKPAGQSNCAGAASPPAPSPAASAPAATSPVAPPAFIPASTVPAPVPSGTAPIPPVAPRAVPAAVQALLSFDPCDPDNADLVCQAQRALGFGPGSGLDGKYGPGTATAARQVLPNAPAGCSPRPGWWAPAGSSNCGGAGPAPSGPATPGPSQPIVVAPEEKKGLSTGAIVAGGLGALALVGLIAVAASGKKSSTSRTTITRPGRRVPSKRRAAPKKSKRKASRKKKR
jgi:hypothetical protein